ncbi:hypothetical protein E3N88_04958 [Mikania micrantha]|uniref:Transmembrane protein n=1 Tax=Mikania micrantha TaxID=192012 RepID=A0A5N6PYM4_9ASTR|nr:hypothetical protein E3N88_04958 [Mikania micrantha]
MNHSILPFTKSPHILTPNRHHHHLLHPQPPTLHLTRNSSNDTNTPADDSSSSNPSPPSTVQVKFKRGARRKTRRKKENGLNDDVMMMGKKEMVKKDWESMTVAEKAMELYVGEKGLLFWINKFAYASIYIIIGVWILFRFVGPALNLYQLDAPPLSPADVLKGSPK